MTEAGGSGERSPRPGRRLAVLGFHKIGTPPASRESWFYVSTGAFSNALRWLRASRWQVISASALLQGLQHPDTLPERSVLLTFDDAYLSVWQAGLPILESFNVPAVLFVPTGFIGRTNLFDSGIEPQVPMCDWSHLRELSQRNVSIQSHGVTHTALSKLDEDGRQREIVESKTALEQGVGRSVEMFSFPYGDAGDSQSDPAPLLREAGYRAAFLFRGTPIWLPVADPFRIDRIPIGPDADLSRALEAEEEPEG